MFVNAGVVLSQPELINDLRKNSKVQTEVLNYFDFVENQLEQP